MPVSASLFLGGMPCKLINDSLIDPFACERRDEGVSQDVIAFQHLPLRVLDQCLERFVRLTVREFALTVAKQINPAVLVLPLFLQGERKQSADRYTPGRQFAASAFSLSECEKQVLEVNVRRRFFEPHSNTVLLDRPAKSPVLILKQISEQLCFGSCAFPNVARVRSKRLEMLNNRIGALTLIVLLLGNALRFNCALASDAPLPVDAENVYGTFDNGLKYIIHPASNPPAKVSLELHVASGALNETDEQNGLAHFVEHMAFKGSDHFEPMKLIPLLSHLGMTFGADTNAHTNATETVYKLTMPDNKPETIDLALTIFSDYANGLKFSPIQIDSERRVILEEARSRKNAAQRLNKKMLTEMLPGARMVSHDVIGDEELVKTFQQPAFFDYWNTWYRPENMTLIVAGDIDPDAVVAVAKEKLGTFAARAPSRTPQTAGIEPFTQANAIVLTDPEQITAKLSIDCMKPPQGPVATVSDYRRQVVEHLAEWIVNHRIIAQIAKGDAPFRNAEVSSQDLLQNAFDVSAEAQGSAKDWRAMLDTLLGQIHSAIDHGFTPQEIDLACRGMLSNDQWAVKTESTADSKAIAAKLAALVGSHSPILSAQQRLDLDQKIASTLTEAELQSSFKSNFDTRNYTYVFLLPAPADPPKSGETPSTSEVLSAAAAAWTQKTAPLEQSSDIGTHFAKGTDARRECFQNK